MSAFLAPIHHWLFNKITLGENLYDSLIKLSEETGLVNVKEEGENLFGGATKGELQDVIDHGNIHGWLQERINSLEYRTAFALTKLTENGVSTETLKEIYFKAGVDSRNRLGQRDNSPEESFKRIFDVQIEGMPCDRVRKVIKNTEEELIWTTTECIHSKYFEKVNGDVALFYSLREAWINGFLSYEGSEISFKTEGNENILYKK